MPPRQAARKAPAALVMRAILSAAVAATGAYGRRVSFDAVVLAGGEARRMGGVDKALVMVGGRSLLERVLEACGAAARVVVVGPERPLELPVTFVSETPRGGGPVPALLAGLQHTASDRVVVLACDMPFLTPSVVSRLLTSIGEADGAALRDAEGRMQPLAAAWKTPALRAALASVAPPPGTGLLGALASLSVVLVDEPEAALDCDTEEDVTWARCLTHP
jgi:molybdopterin-guanine dinucleotide biosynthesis protein A